MYREMLNDMVSVSFEPGKPPMISYRGVTVLLDSPEGQLMHKLTLSEEVLRSRALNRLVEACIPVDLWMGHMGPFPSNDERKEFADAMAEALGVSHKGKR